MRTFEMFLEIAFYYYLTVIHFVNYHFILDANTPQNFYL